MVVIVAGAGPTGLAAACGLLRRGVPVRVLDAAEGPATTSRALAVQPRGAEVLERLGALGDLAERGINPIGATVHAGGRDLLTFPVGAATAAGRHPVILVSQAELEARLRIRLAELGGKIEWGAPVAGAEQDSTGVLVRVDGPVGEVRGDWLLGCDGAHSAVRKIAGIGFPGRPIIERFVLADVHVELPVSRAGTHVWMHEEGLLVLFPLPGADLWRIIAAVGVEEADTLAQLARLVAARTGGEVRFESVEWISTFRIQRRLADTYRRGRLLIAGDAAHIHSPFGGQGLNTGIGDAENLAWKLVLVAKGLAGDALLDTYTAERRPVGADVAAGTTGATRILLAGNAPARFLRDRVILPILRDRRLMRRVTASASQLGVSYRRGPLAPLGFLSSLGTTRHTSAEHVLPGDRVPDIETRTSEGRQTRLYAALQGRFAVVAPSGSVPDLAQARRLGAELVGLTADVPDPMLVRPDAHLAWRAHRARVSPSTYMDLLLG
ncbi:oxygenase [Nocardia panacis]|uniref:Oxygenase n=1 Tax=Nocardia panacis TaxID=2340916 RepID=A0A3A4KN37_9NOCA|nr:FAD-dependent monooxygenase [Nocardia panacis]RJO70956.1 oxygenase [Nocardia panacis]